MKRYYVGGEHTWLIVCTDRGLQGVTDCLVDAELPVEDFDTVREATSAEIRENYQNGHLKLVDSFGQTMVYPHGGVQCVHPEHKYCLHGDDCCALCR